MSIKQDLLEHYSVFASFYTLSYPDSRGSGWKKPCRSALEIIAKGGQSDGPGKAAADAVFVMMNPGSSKAYDETEELRPVSVDDISSMEEKWVKTHPDDTQYQLMRVMKEKGWVRVVVINLSDIRNPNSNGSRKKGKEQKRRFSDEYRELEERDEWKVHSIFHEARKGELGRHLARINGNGKIVLAWGVGNYLGPLIARAKERLKNKEELKGWRKETKNGEEWKFYHPLPRTLQGQDKWRNNCLDDAGCG